MPIEDDKSQTEPVHQISNNRSRDLLFLSRLIKEKGIYEVLEAFKNLHSDYPNIKLVIAGNGEEENRIKKFITKNDLQNKVELTGYVRNKDKVNVFGRTGIFVFPTYSEGCPVSLLEAMAAGHAVITTPVGGIPHIIKNSINGILIDTISSGSVEIAIRCLLDNDILRKQISENNHKAAWDKYNAPAVTRYFEKFYRCEVNGN